MDHLPYPESPRLARMEIDNLCATLSGSPNAQSRSELEHASFSSTLAQSAGTSPKRFWAGIDTQRLGRHAQIHVFFGLLRDILGALFRFQDYSRVSSLSSQPIVSLVLLERRLSAARDQAYFNRQFVVDLAVRARHFVEPVRDASPMSSQVSLSIEILSWTIVNFLDPENSCDWRHGARTSSDILVKRLLAAGWCPAWALTYGNSLSAPLLHFLSGAPQHLHQAHGVCDESTCRAHNVGENYQSRHAEENCACKFQGPRPGVRNGKAVSVGGVIDAGGVPLVRLVENASGRIEMEVVKAEFGKPFIAVSHVWSGGLGNPDDNTMPQCQVRFMYEAAKRCRHIKYGSGVWDMVKRADKQWKSSVFYKNTLQRIGLGDDDGHLASRELDWWEKEFDRWILHDSDEHSDGVYIWMDTLCIPVAQKGIHDDEKKKIDAQKLAAINSMAFVYAGAMQVLVVDSVVREISMEENTDLAIAAALLTSSWMTRAWTFQEGCLARQFSFILKDGIISPRSWRWNTSDRSETLWERVLKFECLHALDSMPDVMNHGIDSAPGGNEERLLAVWNQLSLRSTTKRQDLHSLLAVMLDLSALDILNLDNAGSLTAQHRRMLAILASQDTLPMSMVFRPYPEDIDRVPGYEWVPSFPIGEMRNSYGALRWNPDHTGLVFPQIDTALAILIIPKGADLRRRNRLSISSPYDEGERSLEHILVDVYLLPPYEETSFEHVDKPCCFILHALYPPDSITPDEGFEGVGGCFVINNADGVSRLTLTFISPLRYSVANHSFHQRTSLRSSSENTQDPSVIVVESICPQPECILSCDPTIWPLPKYRRPTATVLQTSPSLPAAAFTFSFWSIYMGAIFLNPCTTVLALSLREAIRHGFMGILPAWLSRFNLLFRTIDTALSYPRVATVGLTVFTRMVAFTMFEFPRLEYITRRIRYERYAETFSYVQPDHMSSRFRSSRLRNEWLYQYQPIWRILVPICIASLNLVAGISPKARNFLIYVPHSSKIHSKFLIIIGKGILIETGLRSVIELMLRYFKLDTRLGQNT